MNRSGLWLTWAELVFLVLVPGILGWGKEGHYTACKIAEGYLTEEAFAAVQRLLPDSAEGDLASVCSWADEIRFHYWWSRPLHYVDTPDFRCNYEFLRDCHDSYGHEGRCVTAAIFNYTRQLSMYHNSVLESSYNLTEALMFLSHFIGDVHQVWDTMIIESALKTFYDKDLTNMIQALQQNLTNAWLNDASSWANCAKNETVCPNAFASESITLACKFAYRNATPGSTLGDEYFLSRLPVVEKRLAQAGVRLAATLNRVFASQVKIAKA
ncbi:hypothetical protein TIFTF001_020052 [Ficus carica]|uniref:Aspergillus nuclease S1 n=1 Tax=Ficus carica TaxID=3494 RepID=A0AA88D9G8_FICCA|nr:hypothetical protein TIFTF001_020052 [Ficus carica]